MLDLSLPFTPEPMLALPARFMGVNGSVVFEDWLPSGYWLDRTYHQSISHETPEIDGKYSFRQYILLTGPMQIVLKKTDYIQIAPL